MRYRRALAIVTVVATAACVQPQPQQCTPPAGGCPRATGTMHMLEATVTWSGPGETPRTATPVITNAAPVDGCTINGVDSEIFSNGYLNATGPMLSCATNSGFIELWVDALKDPRTLTSGVHTLTANEAGLSVYATQGCTDASGSQCLNCAPALSDVEVIITVEDATGGAAPYPALATADYARTFEVKLSMPPRPALARTGTPQCTGDMSVSLTMRWQQTKADWIYDPHGPCEPCE